MGAIGAQSVTILAVSGSLKANSSNTRLIHAIAALAADRAQATFYTGLADLPPFSPDLDTETPPEAVQHWRDLLKTADAVLICTPEYAYGMPGSLKNALDWTVSSGEFYDMPVAAISAAPNLGGGKRALRTLKWTLHALSALIVRKASFTVPLIGKKLDADGHIRDPAFAETLHTALAALIAIAGGTL